MLDANRVTDAADREWAIVPAARRTALLIDSDASEIERAVLPMLFTTLTARTSNEGLIHLRRAAPELLVLPLEPGDRDACALCRAAKEGQSPPAILVLADDVVAAPAAISAGCDSILIRPFPPNLLVTRLARLFPRTLPPDGSAISRFAPTHRRWSSPCPACGRPGVVSFDAASLRRWWCACTACHHVWMSALPPSPSAQTSGSHPSCSIDGVVVRADSRSITTSDC
jgi:hypothetical protein